MSRRRVSHIAAFLTCSAIAQLPARADWTVLQPQGPAPTRSITRRADGRLLGPGNTGHSIEIWLSDAEGVRWERSSVVARDESVNFGDPTVLAIPGTNTVFCAAREHSDDRKWCVKVWRSDDGGKTWAFDSNVAGPTERFVGAPFLYLHRNGDLQCYYDSEQMAADRGYPGFQWIVMQGRNGIAGPWDKYDLVVASREEDPGILTRDGMPTVVSLGGDHLMCVTEGVETKGHGGANVVRTIESRDGGRTWDFARRSIVYQGRVDPVTNRQYNAYVPYAIRLKSGAIWIAFGTDEGFEGPPDFSHNPPHTRHSHVKVIRSNDKGRTWSAPEVVWSKTFSNYHPGLFERYPNDVLCTLDLFGRQVILASNPPHQVASALRGWVRTQNRAQTVQLLRAALGVR